VRRAPRPPQTFEDDLEVRRIEPSEWTVLRSLRLEALRDAPQAFESTIELESRLEESDWLQRIERRAVAFVSGRPVGLVGWSVASEDGGRTELISMWVRPDVRGTTTATRLVDFVKEIARSRGETLELAVRADNARARRFYTKCGFVPLREEPGRLSGEPVVWMRLERRTER
jgi:ribosomal protein S18 acetylase RimI-like enzyme